MEDCLPSTHPLTIVRFAALGFVPKSRVEIAADPVGAVYMIGVKNKERAKEKLYAINLQYDTFDTENQHSDLH